MSQYNEYLDLVNQQLQETNKQDAYEELLELENKLAGAIYYQRCLEKDL